MFLNLFQLLGVIIYCTPLAMAQSIVFNDLDVNNYFKKISGNSNFDIPIKIINYRKYLIGLDQQVVRAFYTGKTCGSNITEVVKDHVELYALIVDYAECYKQKDSIPFIFSQIKQAGYDLVIFLYEKPEDVIDRNGPLIGQEFLAYNFLSMPAVFITRHDGQALINSFTFFVHDDKGLLLLMKDLLKGKGKVYKEVLSLYFTSADRNVYEFLLKLKEDYVDLEKQIDLYPHFITLRYDQSVKSMINNCYFFNKYCLEPVPSLNITSGRQIVIENIRQKCIIQGEISSKDFKVPFYHKYWQYIREFYNNCLDLYFPNFTNECSNSAMEKSSINSTNIDLCIFHSFGSNYAEQLGNVQNKDDFFFGRENNLLNLEQNHTRGYSHSYPALVIDGEKYTGQWKSFEIMKKVCERLYDKPESCFKNLEDNNDSVKKSNSIGVGVILLIIAIIIINIIAIVFYRIYLRKKALDNIDKNDFSKKIDMVVSKYTAFKDTP